MLCNFKKMENSERTLLLLGIFGGGFGGDLLGLFIFNHKKEKLFFNYFLVNIVSG